MPEINSDLNEDVVEIINEPPKWIIRNGLLILFILICVMLILMNYINYNEQIDLDFTLKIKSSEYFKTVTNCDYGNISLQHFDDNLEVKKGDTICIERNKTNSPRYIISPINGTLYSTLNINSLVKTLIIVPKKMFPNIYTHVSLKTVEKIKKGMTVYLEYSSNLEGDDLEGEVSKVFSIPTYNNFLVEIKLKSFLNSKDTYILSQSKIKGKVIINQKTLFSKVFNFI